ncbi:hypothetical protein QTN47_27225 [Danxiaibacter flavus]|uniref:Helix-turn-helix domain-containing protein n=1 Tax=Danxiaibacter flavus TaxID=3049108 RepID=A0ABV3ZPN6_9BACT|nr:hypothetical protein QNM32_27225 [Chitinophagaceae bacterium DXS]
MYLSQQYPMNYLELINQYWDLREQGILLGSEGEYYLFLLHKCNRLAWKNPFNLSNQLCCGYLGIQEKSLIKYRNKLKQVGLIDFKSGTKGNNTEYRIHFPNTCKKYSESGSLSGSQMGSESGSLSGEKRPDNIKQKQDYTKQDNSEVITSPPPENSVPQFNLGNSNLYRQPKIPTIEDVERIFMQHGGTVEMAKKFFEKNNAVGWFMNNNPIVRFENLVPGFIQSWRKNENNGKDQSSAKKLQGRIDYTGAL